MMTEDIDLHENFVLIKLRHLCWYISFDETKTYSPEMQIH